MLRLQAAADRAADEAARWPATQRSALRIHAGLLRRSILRICSLESCCRSLSGTRLLGYRRTCPRRKLRIAGSFDMPAARLARFVRIHLEERAGAAHESSIWLEYDVGFGCLAAVGRRQSRAHLNPRKGHPVARDRLAPRQILRCRESMAGLHRLSDFKNSRS